MFACEHDDFVGLCGRRGPFDGWAGLEHRVQEDELADKTVSDAAVTIRLRSGWPRSLTNIGHATVSQVTESAGAPDCSLSDGIGG